VIIIKLAIIVRTDLGMSKGKIAVQVGHASVAAYRKATNCLRKEHTELSESVRERWYNEGQKKIVLKTKDKDSLLEIAANALQLGFNIEYIKDFGLTQVAPDTLTCIAIGPEEDEKIDSITQELSLL
jgi:PTH2 family peptidyl-tRNA hydrolase